MKPRQTGLPQVSHRHSLVLPSKRRAPWLCPLPARRPRHRSRSRPTGVGRPHSSVWCGRPPSGDAGAAPGPSLQNLPKFRGARPPARATPGGSPMLRAPHRQPHSAKPAPPIHPSIPAGALPAARSRSSSSMHGSSSVHSSTSSSSASAGRTSALGGSPRAQRDPGAAEAGGKPWRLPGRARLPSQKGPAVAPRRPGG